MILYNKTILLPNIEALHDVFINNENPNIYACNCIYADRIAIQHKIIKDKDIHFIQIWRTKSLFDYWFDDFYYSSRNFIACMDYTIYNTYIKINHIGINDDEPTRIYNNPLDENDAEEIIKYLVHFVKIVAKKENKNKIILDVHENFRFYNKYFYYVGFIITNRKSMTNPFWIETEITL